MKSTRFRWLAAIGAVLVLIGIGTALYNLWPDIEYQVGLVDTAYPYPSRFTDATERPKKPRTDRPPPDSRVVIPRIGVNVRIYEGRADRALRLGVYRHAGTALPGESGNMVIAGHRNRRQFALLSYLRPGDRISVYWKGLEYGYRVREVFAVGAVEASILARGDTEMLTLYTCKPRYLGDKRTVVLAGPATLKGGP